MRIIEYIAGDVILEFSKKYECHILKESMVPQYSLQLAIDLDATASPNQNLQSGWKMVPFSESNHSYKGIEASTTVKRSTDSGGVGISNRDKEASCSLVPLTMSVVVHRN